MAAAAREFADWSARFGLGCAPVIFEPEQKVWQSKRFRCIIARNR